MGWTSYHASHYKNGNVDRKAECDGYWTEGLNSNHFKVLKSSMVGSVYYGAVQRLLKIVNKDENGKYIYEPIPEDEREVFAVVLLTSVDNKSYYNFSYKEMDETMNPYYYDCPKCILKLLSPTNDEWANKWRNTCYEKHKKKDSPTSLNKLPVGTEIELTVKYEMTNGYKSGDKIVLVKVNGYKNSYWTDGYYRYTTKIIGEDYKVVNN